MSTTHRTPLRAASAEKLAAAVEDADEAVDGGTPPAAALAKAARDHAVPVGHVPFLVRAFNTGRAVRQLGAGDPWEKAADHPVATVDAVRAVLEDPGAVKAAAAEDRTADYFAPPPDARPRYHLPSLLTAEEKRASVSPREELAPRPPEPAPPDTTVKMALEAGHLLVGLAEAVRTLLPRQYLAVKRAAAEVAPEAAAFAFDFVEVGDPWLRAKGASTERIDSAVTTAHPAVVIVRKLEQIRGAFPKAAAAPVPVGYEPVTTLGAVVDGWFVRSRVDPVFGVPLPAQKLAAAPEPAKTATLFDATPAPPVAVPEEVAKRAGIGGDLAAGFFKPLNWGASVVKKTPMLNEANQDLKLEKSPARPGDRQVDALGAAYSGIDEHAAIQSILADPRFVKADPQTLVQTYRDLANLAPQAMQNPAIASDFLTRKIQTGPLGYHDLEALTRLEANLAKARQRPEADPDD